MGNVTSQTRTNGIGERHAHGTTYSVERICIRVVGDSVIVATFSGHY